MSISYLIDHHSERLGPVVFLTDSKFSHTALTKGCRLSGLAPIVRLVRTALQDYSRRSTSRPLLRWIPGHSGVMENTIADFLANYASIFSMDHPFTLHLPNRLSYTVHSDSALPQQ